MSSNVALVLGARGARNHVASTQESELEEIYANLERLRVKPQTKTSKKEKSQQEPDIAALQKALTLPENLKDWFVPRNADPQLLQWCAGSEADEQLVCKHLATLYRLGIPAFFREPPQPLLMKLFVSLEAHVLDDTVPTDEPARSEFWVSLKDGLLRAVVSAMADVVLDLFGVACNIVVVLDATGWSPAAGQWKVSQRICFVEVAVSQDTARRVRCALVKWLNGPRASELYGGTASVLKEAWEQILDERAFRRGASHRMVFCDAAHGSLALPEERPLLPLALLHATATPGARTELEQVQGVEHIAEADWVRLGSTWTACTAPTEFCSVGCARPQRAPGPFQAFSTQDGQLRFEAAPGEALRL